MRATDSWVARSAPIWWNKNDKIWWQITSVLIIIGDPARAHFDVKSAGIDCPSTSMNVVIVAFWHVEGVATIVFESFDISLTG